MNLTRCRRTIPVWPPFTPRRCAAERPRDPRRETAWRPLEETASMETALKRCPVRCAAAGGFNLHANVSIGARDRERLQRLLRYAARPALALERLSKLPDGRLVYRLKRPWSDGTTDLVFEPQDFIAKLAALVPAPRIHLTRFHGILAPAAKWRPLIIPAPIVEPDILSSTGPLPAPESGEGSEASIPEQVAPNHPHSRRNYTWARLMMRVFPGFPALH